MKLFAVVTALKEPSLTRTNNLSCASTPPVEKPHLLADSWRWVSESDAAAAAVELAGSNTAATPSARLALARLAALR